MFRKIVTIQNNELESAVAVVSANSSEDNEPITLNLISNAGEIIYFILPDSMLSEEEIENVDITDTGICFNVQEVEALIKSLQDAVNFVKNN